MAWLLEPLEPEFMQRALLAGLAASLACSVVGTWVVLRGLSFFGEALSHGVLPGLALAVLWGFDLLLGAAASAAVMIAGITLVGRRARLGDDTGIGLLFIGMLALGVVIISHSDAFTADLHSLLFGEVLGVRWGDLVPQAVAALLVVLASVAGYRPFLALAFNADKAASLGLRPRLAHLAMLVLMTVAIVSSVQVVGTLLVVGLLIGPPATAVLVVRRVWQCMVVAALAGWLSVAAGLVISFHWGTATGATMAGVSIALFFTALAVQEAARFLRYRYGGASPHDHRGSKLASGV